MNIMINSGNPISHPANETTTGEERLEAFSTLLSTLKSAVGEGYPGRTQAVDTLSAQELQARLGIATSLFIALRSKHPATASHSLRVALGVSSWLQTMDLSTEERDVIEIAALLHDIGKIGVADVILEKSGKLTDDEVKSMDQCREIGREILSVCSNSKELVSTVQNVGIWFHSTLQQESSNGAKKIGEPLPLGARLIAIVDAYDSMTTDRIYRPAMSVERATAELFGCAGTQFDPDLVHDFCELLDHGRIHFDAAQARNWLNEIAPDSNNLMWGWHSSASEIHSPTAGSVPSNAQLLQHMHDGVIFVDAQLRILLWNRAAERMTGISQTSVLRKHWSPALLGFCNEDGQSLPEEECPVAEGLLSGVHTSRRLIMQGPNKTQIAIEAQVAPVLASDSTIAGITLVVHDVSSQITLEERVHVLHEQATRDPLTKVANRAEFDRLLPLFVEAHKEQGVTCSMIMCDIDFFKSINDTHGHQAGDEALMLFATSLQRHARAGDLVARYGGEEFVLLCAQCDNATATRRADEARIALASQPLPPLNGKRLTASFGVSEVQAGDTPETFLRRTDRALLQAKDNGRNQVVQLGIGVADDEPLKPKFNLFAWLAGQHNTSLVKRNLISVMPLKVIAEKLRGFVADQGAEVVNIVGNRVLLIVDGHNTPFFRRWNDRAIPLVIELVLQEHSMPSEGSPNVTRHCTTINVTVRLKRQRDRRCRDAAERARQLCISIKSYLMAHESPYNEELPSDDSKDPSDPSHTTRVLSNSLKK